MSSSWSEIRSRADNDPLLDTISDLQAKANQAEAINNITTTDKIPPIRIIKSKVEISDKAMMTGYTRPHNTATAYYLGKEPDGEHLRLQARFDSGCDTLNDYSMQGNTINIGYQDTLPILLKATEDDGITAGDMVSVADGKAHHYRIPVTDAVSIKRMVIDGKPGITIIYRHFPLFIQNESNSAGTQRATPLYMIENDQVEYAVKWEVDDAGYVYFFFRYQFINYYVRSVNPMIEPPPVSDFVAPDYSPADFAALPANLDVNFPISYVDLAMEFNFTTKAITMYVNAVLVPTTTVSVVLVPPEPAPMFPPAFADPPPPPEQPEPYFQPFERVYEQLNETSSLKVNAMTTTQQNAFYNIPGSPPSTDPNEIIAQVRPPNNNLYPGGSQEPTTVDWNNINNYVLLGEVLSTTDNGISLGTTTNISTAARIDSATVGVGPNLVGKVVHRLSFQYKRVDSVEGTVYGRVWDAGGNIIYTFDDAGRTINITSGQNADPVTGYTADHARSLTQSLTTHVMAVGERIGLEFVPSSAGQLMIQTTATNTEPALSISTRAVGAATTAWTADNTRDLAFKFWRRKTQAELDGGIDPGGGGGGGGGGTGGAVDQYGVRSAYATGEISYDFEEDFKAGSYRWDFADLGPSRFVSQELIVYVRSDDPPEDECTGIMGGGTHGDEPHCYNVGVDTITGETRYRMEEEHPDNIDGEDGGTGVGLRDTYVGYRYVKRNRSNGVLLEIWQDTGANEGTTPANNWHLVSSWVESEFNWQQPPDDHQITFRIDGDDDQLETLEVKWMSIREIKTTDPTTAGTAPAPAPMPSTPIMFLGEILPTDATSSITLSKSTNEAIAIQVNDMNDGLGQKLVGRGIYRAKFAFKPANNPTGRLFCKVWDILGNEAGVVGDPAGLDVSTLANTAAGATDDGNGWFSHVFTGGTGNTAVIQEGYKIGVEWKTASTTASILVRRVGTNVDDSVCQATKTTGATSFTINMAFDIRCAFWEAPLLQFAPLPIPQALGDGGAADTFGVKATYSSATGSAINYNWIENFQDDSYRFDFEGLGTSFASAELIGYFRFTDNPPDDEVAGKMTGGNHTDGSSPKCYVLGCGITDGATRYRLEENHPETTGGSSGGTGKALGSAWTGYKYVKWNKGNSVLLEIWQDQGNNETAPANNWVRLASWNVTSPLWLTPPSDHQETIRIDQVDDNLEWKWLSLRPIGTNDTGTPDTGGGGGGTTGGSNTTYDTWPSSTPLSNNLLSNYIAVQSFGAGALTIGSIPTTLEFIVWRNDTATSGTYHIRHYDSLGNVRKTYHSAGVSTLPSIIPDDYNIVWQDILNDTSLRDNDMIGVEVEGVINSARVYVMNNKVSRGEVSGGTTIPGTTTTTNTPPIIAPPPNHFMKVHHPGNGVLSSAVIHFIFWGNDWNTRTSPWSKNDIMAALDQVFQSKFWDGLIQYGIKRPRRGVSIISNEYPAYDNYSPDDIIGAIREAILKGLVPKPAADSKQAYMLIPNPNQTIGNYPDLVGAGGYHSIFWMLNNDPIAFRPQSTVWPGNEAPISYGWSRGAKSEVDFNYIMMATTHEICEIVTDPFVFYEWAGVMKDLTEAQWGDDRQAEICDVCPAGVVFNGYTMASWWSNQNSGCKGDNNATPGISCPSGKTYDASIQLCKGTAATPSVTIGGTYSNDYDDVRSCYMTKTTGSTQFASLSRTVDLVMLVRRGGGDFIGYIELDSRRKRVGAKANQDGSLLIGKVMSKIDLIMKRVGVTPLTGNIYCNIRDSGGNLMQAIGMQDARTIGLNDTPVTLINAQHSYGMVEGDCVSIEYDNGEVSTGGGTTGGTVISAPIVPAQPSTQGMIYYGGPVYSEANVYIIFDGNTWNTLTTPFTKQQFMEACDIVFQSTYFDALLQYGIRKPKFHAYVVNTTLPLPTTYTLTNVRATIEDSKTRSQVPSHLPTSQHNIYIVMAAPGKTFPPPSGIGVAVAANASYWTDSADIVNTATAYAVNTFSPTDTLSRITRSTFHEIVELMASPININTTTVSPNAWKVNPAVLSTANGVQICDPGEGLNPVIGTAGGGNTGGGGGGVTDTFGVKATYATGTIKYDWFQNFQADSYRFDFEDIYPNFVSCELIGYFAADETWDDEVSGKMGGGQHSSGSRPQVYDMGVGIQDGATRYRTEDFHPDYTGGESGGDGEPLKTTYTGYKFIKWNKANSVLLEIWQDTGNNETTPSNQWERVSSWNVTDPLWLIPKSDHQETLRIDGVESGNLHWKWLSLREIRPTDTETGTSGGGGTPVGVTVAAYYSNLDTGVVPPPTAPTWISCASGGTYNPVIQACTSVVTGGGGGGGGTPSAKYLMVRISDGFFNAADASKTMLFEGVVPNVNLPSTVFNRDLAGVMYTGGRPDLAARPMRGVKVATTASILYDKVISEVRLKLKGTGILPLGNILRVKIIRGADKVTMAVIGQLDINSISTTQFIEYYFQNPGNNYRMKVGDLVALEFNHGNSDFNYLEVATSTPGVIDVHNPQPELQTYDSINTIMFEHVGTSWTDDSTRDISGSMSIGGFTVEPDPIVIPPQPPFHYAHEWFISATAPQDSGGQVGGPEPTELLPKPHSHYNNIAKEVRIYDFLLTPQQLQNYYDNRFSITPLPRGQIAVVGHAITSISTS